MAIEIKDGNSTRLELQRECKARLREVVEQRKDAQDKVKNLKQFETTLQREINRLVDGDIQLMLDLETGEVK